MANERLLCTEIIEHIFNDKASFSVFKNEVPEKDRAFVNMLVMTCFRELTFIKAEVLAKFVKKKIPKKQQILEFILYLAITELLFMQTPPYAIISSYVEIAKIKDGKFGANFVNAILRNVSRQKDLLLEQRKTKFFSTDFLKILKKDYSQDDVSAMEKFAELEAYLDITLKDQLNAKDFDGILLPTGNIRLPQNTKVETLEGFNDGKWWVQDVSSSLAVHGILNITQDLHNKKVLDLCAAPGGKTAQLLSLGAEVTAVDISETRIQKLKENMARLHLTEKLKVIVADALTFIPEEKFDIVLIDAPCSATGTFRRHPEIIHTKTIDDVKMLCDLQQKILEHACNFVKPSGILVYATCSLAKDEGERQILNFINKHDMYQIIPAPIIPKLEKINTKEGFWRILPHYIENGADGFFIAYLQRKI